MKRQIGAPMMVGAILLVLLVIGFFVWKSTAASEPHEVAAPAKNPDENPMFKGMRESMRSSAPASGQR